MSDTFEESPPSGLTGWVCRPGRIFETQHDLAQALGQEVEENALDYDELPSVVWDGVSPLALFDSDVVFWDRAELMAFCAEAGMVPDELELIHVHPLRVAEIVPEMICPNVPDPMLPPIVMAAILHLNQVVTDAGPLGWMPVPVAALIID